MMPSAVPSRHQSPAAGLAAPVSAPVIGVALGGGSARGWAHIGVLRALVAHGLRPQVVAGTSIGSIVGAAFAAGKLDALEAFARQLNRRRMLRMMDLSFGGGSLVTGTRLKRRLDSELTGMTIGTLPVRFAAIATELGTGREVCLDDGDLVEAIRASYALPGIFPPIRVAGRWLFDGAMSNPVPVSVARGLGADFVIAINLTAGLGGETEAALADVLVDPSIGDLDDLAEAAVEPTPTAPKRLAFNRRRFFTRRLRGTPGIASVVVGAFTVAQERISCSRLAMDPPDVMLNARLSRVGLFDFHRAAELIDHGRDIAERAMPHIIERLQACHARQEAQ
jgi:NTE family protein